MMTVAYILTAILCSDYGCAHYQIRSGMTKAECMQESRRIRQSPPSGLKVREVACLSYEIDRAAAL